MTGKSLETCGRILLESHWRFVVGYQLYVAEVSRIGNL